MGKLSKFFLVLGTIISICSPTISFADEGLIIQQALIEANEAFLPIRFELLKDCPEVIPTLAEWEYQDWHRYDTSLTRERLVEGFTQCLNSEKLPLTIVAFKDSLPVGVISLESKGEPEFSDLEDGNPWGGSFHVLATERNQGLGETLARTVSNIAKRLGYQKINFYTSRIEVVSWYTSRGAEIVEMNRPYRGHQVTIMKFKL